MDGWVEYMQTQLKLLAGGLINMADSFQPNGAFDDETEGYVKAFQHYHHIQADGIVGDETWNMLHGNSDTVDPHGDGRAPHSYVEETPRLEWENDGHYDVGTDSYTYIAMNVGQSLLRRSIPKKISLRGSPPSPVESQSTCDVAMRADRPRRSRLPAPTNLPSSVLHHPLRRYGRRGRCGPRSTPCNQMSARSCVYSTWPGTATARSPNNSDWRWAR